MTPTVLPNYFTCTLGEARRWKERHPESSSFNHVIDLVDQQASLNPQKPAVGFADFDGVYDEEYKIFLTFSELSTQSTLAAYKLRQCGIPDNASAPIALLCTSSMDFVLTWLGLTRLGHRVLLLAPQLEATAINHLCQSASVATILTDARQEDRCASVTEDIAVLRIPAYDEPSDNIADGWSSTIDGDSQATTPSGTALWFHSSGTSSGLPKVIPQTHEGLVAALPSFSGDQPATFTTTPLYHGGLVDALRAWSSGAMVWFFPEGTAPITAANIGKAVDLARSINVCLIGYFSSVPYILQMLADDERGLELLKGMSLVGVGGAALPDVTGTILVKQGVCLLSRMGSAECGFLMSSHRNYTNDKDWQFLRPIDDKDLIDFEPRDDGLAELVVKPGWPHLAKTNRDDGSYATSDLFEPHHHTPGLWRYHSRADAQITLSNGKKFDPSPMEASIVASTNLLEDVLIFGDGRDYPGVLLLSQDAGNDLVDAVWPIIERLNTDTQSHAKISRSMVVAERPDTQPALEKSSKGTILRRKAESRYEDAIDKAYSQLPTDAILSDSATREELYGAVVRCFRNVLGRDIQPGKDLYAQGVDSIACIQIRGQVQKACLPIDSHELPLNILYDKGTIEGLVVHLWRLRQAPAMSNGVENSQDEAAAQNQAMLDLAAKFKAKISTVASTKEKPGEAVVLTGATGFLGSHILRLLLSDDKVLQIFCLIRASTAEMAAQRLTDTLSQRGLALEDSRVLCVPCNLARGDLGLSSEMHYLMTEKATLIIHSAWTVNFSLHLNSFEDQISGTVNLVNFAAQADARMVFISSTAAVSNSTCINAPEQLSAEPKDSSPLGYSQSKWVAEQVCAVAAQGAGSNPTHQRHAVLIVRVGQLCGDERGVWSASEAYPLMLSTAKLVGCLPRINGEVANWMPVHLAAQAVVDIASHSTEQTLSKQPMVFHVINHHNTPSWEEMLHWLQTDGDSGSGNPTFDIRPASKWVSDLEEASGKGGTHHPAFALIGLWRNAFKDPQASRGESSESPRKFDTAKSRQVSPVMRNLQPLDQTQVLKMWRWVNKSLP